VPDYNKSVFINCPYDKQFGPLFHAIVLTVAACGFTPRCARETEFDSSNRAGRIADLLCECKYSIHDLSRHRGEGDDNLARLNMAFELGIAFGTQQLRAKLSELSHPDLSKLTHQWLVMGPPESEIEKALSDLKGFQHVYHDLTVQKVIARVWACLTTLKDFETGPPAKTIFESYPQFLERLESRQEEAMIDAASGETLTWQAILRSAQEVAGRMPTPPLA
jgi:hypothetical protein